MKEIDLKKVIQYNINERLHPLDYAEKLEGIILKNPSDEIKTMIADYENYLLKIKKDNTKEFKEKLEKKILRFEERLEKAKEENIALKKDKQKFGIGNEAYDEKGNKVEITDIYKGKLIVNNSLYPENNFFSNELSARGFYYKEKNAKILLNYPHKIEKMKIELKTY